jgi:hypothetical protein
MVLIATGEQRFCIDIYEASLVETVNGEEKPFPHWLPVDGHAVRAVSVAGAFPQAFISEVQAEDACTASGKRLCAHAEWKTACVGPAKTTFPYGEARAPGTCHDEGKSAVGAVFGAAALADPVAAVAAPSKASHAGAGATAGKTRPAHVTEGKAAQATRPRPAEARTGNRSSTSRDKSPRDARAERQPRRDSRGDGRRDARVDARGEGQRDPTRRETRGDRHDASRRDTRGDGRTAKRSVAKASARPESVAPSVWTQLNDPRLGQVEGALARTGSHEACVSGFGVFDIVGNLHEWVKTDPSLPHGTFAGGYYLDTALNGDGCNYRTTAHAHDYHDYSTGFRCCADAR